ncbi:MAG: hypothetical protein H6704_13610 [Myxococcales bacterium]|nr:hypothetical protein [Myxococcales bacterium]
MEHTPRADDLQAIVPHEPEVQRASVGDADHLGHGRRSHLPQGHARCRPRGGHPAAVGRGHQPRHGAQGGGQHPLGHAVAVEAHQAAAQAARDQAAVGQPGEAHPDVLAGQRRGRRAGHGVARAGAQQAAVLAQRRDRAVGRHRDHLDAQGAAAGRQGRRVEQAARPAGAPRRRVGQPVAVDEGQVPTLGAGGQVEQARLVAIVPHLHDARRGPHDAARGEPRRAPARGAVGIDQRDAVRLAAHQGARGRACRPRAVRRGPIGEDHRARLSAEGGAHARRHRVGAVAQHLVGQREGLGPIAGRRGAHRRVSAQRAQGGRGAPLGRQGPVARAGRLPPADADGARHETAPAPATSSGARHARQAQRAQSSGP